jgi:hypothetical protein
VKAVTAAMKGGAFDRASSPPRAPPAPEEGQEDDEDVGNLEVTPVDTSRGDVVRKKYGHDYREVDGHWEVAASPAPLEAFEDYKSFAGAVDAVICKEETQAIQSVTITFNNIG